MRRRLCGQLLGLRNSTLSVLAQFAQQLRVMRVLGSQSVHRVGYGVLSLANQPGQLPDVFLKPLRLGLGLSRLECQRGGPAHDVAAHRLAASPDSSLSGDGCIDPAGQMRRYRRITEASEDPLNLPRATPHISTLPPQATKSKRPRSRSRLK